MPDISKHLRQIERFRAQARYINELAIKNHTTPIARNFKTLKDRTISAKTLQREYYTPPLETPRESRLERLDDLYFSCVFANARGGNLIVRHFIEIDNWFHGLDRFTRRRSFDDIQEENQLLYSQLRTAYRLKDKELAGEILSQIKTNDYEMARILEIEVKEEAARPHPKIRRRRDVAVSGMKASALNVVDLSRWKKTA